MNFFEKLTSSKTALFGSLIVSAVIIYPNIGEFLLSAFSPKHYVDLSALAIAYFTYRYLFFVLLIWILIRLNIRKAEPKLSKRFWKSFTITLIAYSIYVFIGLTIERIIRKDCFTQMLILQFLIAWLVSVLIGQIYYLTVVQKQQEKEMERLRVENLQSRVDALVNQINPHFFFNSLNGLTALVADNRQKETMEYVTKLSNIFRYILQSEKKGLVSLEDELKFLDAYKYLIEVRYSGKMCFKIKADEADLSLQLPVLSLLPLMENVVKHNIIDSEHKMVIDISVSDRKGLIITNPIYRKYSEGVVSHGIGLTNLSSRYKLLMGKDIEIKEDNDYFSVALPLIKPEHESSDC
jgi:sensor histidine kinase YesM